ncbi:MAG: uracil phosphoribosyltransferase [bacterium]
MSQSLVEHVAQSAAHQKIEMRPTFVVIMRSGVSMLDGALTACPDAPVGHIGLHRDPRTFIAMEYYCKLPHIQGRDCIVLDPQMATGHTAVAAADRLVPMQPRSVTFVAALTTPVAIDYLATYHPGVAVLAASLEDGVDEHGEVVPGFGDVGQRLYGTA